MTHSRRTLILAVAVTGLCLGAQALVPPAVLDLIDRKLPMAFGALPKKMPTGGIRPVGGKVSRVVQRKAAPVDLNCEMVLLEFAEGRRTLRAAYSAGGTYTNAWFKTDDVIGALAGKPVEYAITNAASCLWYRANDRRRPVLTGYGPGEASGWKLGEVRFEGEVYTLLLVDAAGEEVGGNALTARLGLVRPRSAFKEEDYRQRVKEMLAEVPYQHLQPWGDRHRPILAPSQHNYGCAGFVTDFARYLFDAHSFGSGTRFTDANEIRAGDVLRLNGHFIGVLDRVGDQLITFDGNCNHAIRRSSRAYAVKDNQITGSKKLICGWHYLSKPPVDEKGKGRGRTSSRSGRKTSSSSSAERNRR